MRYVYVVETRSDAVDVPSKAVAITTARRAMRGDSSTWRGELPPAVRVYRSLPDRIEFVFGSWRDVRGRLHESFDAWAVGAMPEFGGPDAAVKKPGRVSPVEWPVTPHPDNDRPDEVRPAEWPQHAPERSGVRRRANAPAGTLWRRGDRVWIASVDGPEFVDAGVVIESGMRKWTSDVPLVDPYIVRITTPGESEGAQMPFAASMLFADRGAADTYSEELLRQGRRANAPR